MSVSTFTKAGTKATTSAKLDKNIFGVEVKNHELLKSVYVAYLANGRANLARTLKRGEVSGGGKKPWKQKGTGRARFGSSRNPIWRGGGVAFGPTGNENYSHKVNKTAKAVALRQALSLASDSNKIIIIEDFALKEAKTKLAVQLLEKIGATGNVLVVVTNKSDELVKATSNLESVLLTQATYLNVYGVLNADHIVITEAALAEVTKWLSVAPKGGDK